MNNYYRIQAVLISVMMALETTILSYIDVKKPLELDEKPIETTNTCGLFETPPKIDNLAVLEAVSRETKEENKHIVLNFVGDCTIGNDLTFGYHNSFDQVFHKNDSNYSYFFQNLQPVIGMDDLTIANLETTFTDTTKKQDKRFNFKGDPSYVNILTKGSVEVVNLANNHTMDYLQEGYEDTKSTLSQHNIDYYGYKTIHLEEVNGIKIGFAGFNVLKGYKQAKKDVIDALEYMKQNNVQMKIITFHWGIERDYQFNKEQQELAHLSIDQGADLIVGHHPHVLQGIEQYKGKYIIYSLGNFVFGGNKNPKDKDSMILSYSVDFTNGNLVNESINIIPVLISSKTNGNDYQPYIVENEDKQRILQKINNYSYHYQYEIE